MFGGVGLELGSDMMPGAWLALDRNGCVVGSGVIGVGEQWNGDKRMVTAFKVSPEILGEFMRRCANTILT